MNLFKKATASVALVALVSGVFSTGVAAYSTSEVEAANMLASKGIINTQADVANYNLGQNVLRQEIAKVAANIAGIDAKTSCDNSFADVTATTPNTWACSYVEALLDAGKVSANENFRPEANISKSEAVKMVLEAAGFTNIYTDAAKWQEQVVAFAEEKGVTSSFSNYNTPATRGFIFEAAANAVSANDEDDSDNILDDILGDLDEDNTDEDNTDEDNTPVVSGDNKLVVELSPKTAKGEDLPSGAEGVSVFTFDLTAGSEDVTVTSAVLKRVGLGSSDAVSQVAIFDETGRVSKVKSFNSSSDEASVNFSPAVVVKAGETKTLTAKVNTNTAGNFAVELTNVVATSSVEGGDISGSEFEVKSTVASEVVVSTDGSSTNPKLGEDQAELLKFKIKNNSSTNEDITIEEITLKENESIDQEDELANVALYFKGDKVAEVASMNGKYVTFKLNKSVIIEEGKTEKFVVKADITGGAGDKVEFVLDNDLDVTAKASKYGYVKVTNNLEDTDVAALDVQAGEVTIDTVDPTNTDIRKDKDDVVFGTIKVNANAGKDLEIQKFTVKFVNSAAGNITDLLENVELYDATNGTLYDLTREESVAATTENYRDNDLSISIPSGKSLELVVRADTKDVAAVNGAKITASIDVANKVTIKETEDDKTVTDVVPSQVSFKTVEGVASSVEINKVAMSTTKTAVIGSTGIEAHIFEVKAANDASDLTVDELKVKLTVVDAGGSDTLGDNKRVNAVYLYNGDTLLDKVSGSQLAAGVATFNGFKVKVAKNTAQRFTVKLDVIDDINQANDTLKASVVGYSIEDDESDDVYLAADNDKDGDLEDQTATVISNRTITIKGTGTLTNLVDNTDSATDKSKNVMAGTTSDFVASYELTATNEDILIKDFTLTETGSSDLVNAVSEVIVYANDKTTEIARETVTGDVVTFDNANVKIPQGNSNIYVKVVTHKIGKDQAGQQTADLNLAFQATDVEGADSSKTITAPVATAVSNQFSVVPVRVSAVAFVSSAKGTTVDSKLTNGENTIAILAITTDSSSNTKVADGTSLKTVLKTLKFNLTSDATIDPATGVVVERLSGPGSNDLYAAAVADGVTTVDLTTASAVNNEIDNGQTAYYAIKATVSGLTDSTQKYAQVKLSNLDSGDIVYASTDSDVDNISALRLSIDNLTATKVSQ